MRMSCAIPRASLRSVLTTIADSADLTWRVSKSTTLRARCASTERSPEERYQNMGSVVTVAFLTILPGVDNVHTRLFQRYADSCITLQRLSP
jgi:hypothetical protein